MHPTVMEWAARQLADLRPLRVLEVGSYDVNGTVRDLFVGVHEYVGVDVVPGPGVDQVYDGFDLPFDTGSFDVVVSTEMLEHCTAPWHVMAEMARVCVDGGHVLVTARGWVVTKTWRDSAGVEVGEVATFGYHNPPDLWRYSAGAMRALAEHAAGLHVLSVEQDSLVPGWFLHATKPTVTYT